MNFDSADLRHLEAAEGFAELGMNSEANTELEKISPELRQRPAVLAIRVKIYRAYQQWDLMQVTTARLAQCDPDNLEWIVLLAHATQRAETTEAAKRVLVEGLERHPDAAILHFNLACCECLLGAVDEAKHRLAHAFKLDPMLRIRALDDEDLAGMWD